MLIVLLWIILWIIKYFAGFFYYLACVENKTIFLFQISPFSANGRNLLLYAYRDDFCISLNRSSWTHGWMTNHNFNFLFLCVSERLFFCFSFHAANLQNNLKSSWREPLVEQPLGSIYWARSPLPKAIHPRASSDFSTKVELLFPTQIHRQQCRWCWKGQENCLGRHR